MKLLEVILMIVVFNTRYQQSCRIFDCAQYYNITIILPGGHSHSDLSTHFSSLITCPSGQAQPGLHILGHTGLGFLQVPSQGAHSG